MEDLSKLSKKELLEHIAQLQAKSEATVAPVEPTPAPVPQTATINVQDLMAALVAAREVQSAPAVAEDTQTYKVINASGMALGIQATDERTGVTRTYSLPKKGDFCKLTRGQVDELRERAPHFFERGYVSVPDLMEDNANVIRNIDKFLAELKFDDIDGRIALITSKDTLFTLFNHIESKRFVHEDERGQPLKNKVGGEEMLVIKEIKLDPKLAAVERAVKTRLEEVSGIRLNLDGK